jgi:exopolysaccharide biosynthesis polyprenyl glycosylphosphotransferase
MLAIADFAGVSIALTTIALVSQVRVAALPWCLPLIPAWLLLAKLYGLYDQDQRRVRHLTADELSALASWALVGAIVTTLILSAAWNFSDSVLVALGIWSITMLSTTLLRTLARALWRRLVPPERVLVIGSGTAAQAIERKLHLFRETHARIVHLIDDERFRAADREEIDALFGSESNGTGVDRIIVATATVDAQQIAELVRACRRGRTKLSVVPPPHAMFGTAVQLEHVAELPMVAYNTWDVPRSTVLLKRVLDIVGSALALVVLTPLLIVAAVAARLDGWGPSLFVQWRAGRDGHPFRMYKLRTMADGAEDRLGELISIAELPEPVFKLRHDPRVTRVGRVLRRTSIDELPQLFNVLRGEMSLVGPRPEQLDLVDRYSPEQRVRLSVKPGITGPMQVYGRGALTFEERLAVEREYIENLSLHRDLRILMLTIAPVLSGIGAF